MAGSSGTPSVGPLLEGRLTLVTGKGGTGKSTVAAALAVLGAARGRRVLLAELDMSRPTLTSVFGVEPTDTPKTVLPRLDVANIRYAPSLERFIGNVVPMRRIVRLIINNPIIRKFLDFTPGAREMVTLSRLVDLSKEYDLVVVDLPASGHAFSLLDVTRSALGLFRSGPMRERAQVIRNVLEADTTRLAMVALPEDMVVNETLETHARLAEAGLLARPPVVVLNRGTRPTLTDDERALLAALSDLDLDDEAAEFVAAGRWEDRLEQATAEALDRLGAALEPPLLVPPATEGGRPCDVVRSIAVNLGRSVGVTRRDLPDLDLPRALSSGLELREARQDGVLDTWLDDHHLLVTVGSGGVGKTTSAAAIGLYAARRGRRVMVLTIDPARRLANSLGLEAIGNAETRIDLAPVEPDATGELWAMMLDSRSTMDALVARVAEPDVAERIFDNHVYRHMADTFAGSQDYMATEKLYDLVTSGAYDLVVLDTPPVKNALDFLESPGRLLNFLDEKVLEWFLEPRQASGWSGLMWGTSAIVHRLLGHVFGNAFLDDLAVFFEDFQGLYDGFRERHERVVGLLRGEDPDLRTSFVTICAPTQSSLDVASYFTSELARRRLPRAGIVVNQVHRCEGETHDARHHLAGVVGDLVGARDAAGTPWHPRTGPSLLARLGMAHRRLRNVVDAEREMIVQLRHEARGGGFYQEVPRLDREVHDLPSLAAVGTALFGPSREL
jgi:anion-transporting  ArsA/GET3 family ATPase